MKNKLYIDIDTDRDTPIKFGKSPDTPAPETDAESSAMILNDIVCLSEALTILILMAHQSGYAHKEDLVHASVKTIYEALNNPTQTENQNESEENSTNSPDNGNP